MSGQTSKKRKEVEGWAYAEQKSMTREDEISHDMRYLKARRVSCERIPLPNFDSGQSDLQLRAGLKEAEEMQWSYKGSDWCASDFEKMLAYEIYGDISDCGIEQTPSYILISV